MCYRHDVIIEDDGYEFCDYYNECPILEFVLDEVQRRYVFIGEQWRPIEGFDGYEVSTKGRVRTYWKKKHYPTGYGTYRYLSDEPQIMSASDDGNGYLKLMLYNHNDGKRYCKKVHRLVAEAFLPRPADFYEVEYTVDHILSGRNMKHLNHYANLRWVTRAENIKKAYADGVCEERIRRQDKPVVLIDLITGVRRKYRNTIDIANELGISHSTLYHAIRKGSTVAKRYKIERLEGSYE